jgi:hypothetical protein
VIVPAIIEKIYCGIESARDKLVSFLLILCGAQVVSTHSEGRDLYAGLAQQALRNLIGRTRILLRLSR